jgi:hypothetical protein
MFLLARALFLQGLEFPEFSFALGKRMRDFFGGSDLGFMRTFREF